MGASCSKRSHACIADTPDETVELLESVLTECTAYQVAGPPMSKADSEQLEDEITEAVLAVSFGRLHDSSMQPTPGHHAGAP